MAKKKVDEKKLLQSALEVFLIQTDKDGTYMHSIDSVLDCLMEATKQLIKDNHTRNWLYPEAYNLYQLWEKS